MAIQCPDDSYREEASRFGANNPSIPWQNGTITVPTTPTIIWLMLLFLPSLIFQRKKRCHRCLSCFSIALASKQQFLHNWVWHKTLCTVFICTCWAARNYLTSCSAASVVFRALRTYQIISWKKSQSSLFPKIPLVSSWNVKSYWVQLNSCIYLNFLWTSRWTQVCGKLNLKVGGRPMVIFHCMTLKAWLRNQRTVIL